MLKKKFVYVLNYFKINQEARKNMDVTATE